MFFQTFSYVLLTSVFVSSDVFQKSSVIFSNNSGSSSRSLSQSISPSALLPLDMSRRMDLGTGVLKELIQKFGKLSESPTPTFARCQLELQTVELPKHKDPTKMYFPKCIKLYRCGGCCTHPSFNCQPTEVENLSFNASVLVNQEPDGKEIVYMQAHKKCICSCKVKAKDCTPSQTYSENECCCKCSNKEEKEKCSSDKGRLWNPSTCSCECREMYPCSTGLVFDLASCGCVSQLSPFTIVQLGRP